MDRKDEIKFIAEGLRNLSSAFIAGGVFASIASKGIIEFTFSTILTFAGFIMAIISFKILKGDRK